MSVVDEVVAVFLHLFCFVFGEENVVAEEPQTFGLNEFSLVSADGKLDEAEIGQIEPKDDCEIEPPYQGVMGVLRLIRDLFRQWQSGNGQVFVHYSFQPIPLLVEVLRMGVVQ